MQHDFTPKTILRHLQDIAGAIEEAQGETFLRELKARWDNHNKSMQMIRDILMVSCRCYLTPSQLPWSNMAAGVVLGSWGGSLCGWQALQRLRFSARENIKVAQSLWRLEIAYSRRLPRHAGACRQNCSVMLASTANRHGSMPAETNTLG